MSRLESALARECLYRFFALAVTEPRDLDWFGLMDGDNQRLARDSAALLAEEDSGPSCSSLDAFVAELQQPATTVHEEFQRVFGLTPARECPPFETEYHGNAEPFYCSQQLADIAGFYRAFGLNPAPMATVRPDHLALELEFMAFLLMKQRLLQNEPDAAATTDSQAVCAKAEVDFFRDHVSWWVPAFAAGLVKRAGHGLYAELGKALAAFVAAECRRLDVKVTRLPLAVVAPQPREEPTECAGCMAN